MREELINRDRELDSDGEIRKIAMDDRAEQEELKNRDRAVWRKTSQRACFHGEATNPEGSHKCLETANRRSCTSLRVAPPPCPAAPSPPAPSTPCPFPPTSPLPGGRTDLAASTPGLSPEKDREPFEAAFAARSPPDTPRRAGDLRHPQPLRRPWPSAPGGPDPRLLPARRNCSSPRSRGRGSGEVALP